MRKPARRKTREPPSLSDLWDMVRRRPALRARVEDICRTFGLSWPVVLEHSIRGYVDYLWSLPKEKQRQVLAERRHAKAVPPEEWRRRLAGARPSNGGQRDD